MHHSASTWTHRIECEYQTVTVRSLLLCGTWKTHEDKKVMTVYESRGCNNSKFRIYLISNCETEVSSSHFVFCA